MRSGQQADTPLFLRETAVVVLKRGQIVKVNGVPLELLADVECKTATANIRALGRSIEVIDGRGTP